MAPLLRPLLLFCLIGLAIRGPALADSAKAPPVHEGPKISIQGYGGQNPACHSWTNGCVLCIRDEDGRSQCSTPGIACQPHGITCKVKAD